MDAQRRLEIEWADDVESELVAHVVDVVEYALKAAGVRIVAQAKPLMAVTQAVLQKPSGDGADAGVGSER